VLLASGIHDSFWEEKKYHDFLPQRDKFASRMDLINLIIDGLRRARTARLMVSANPLDLYLCSSDHIGYISCYNPYSIHYPGGSWQYMMNPDSVVLYHLKPDDEDTFPYRKVGRAWLLLKEQKIVVGRGYGTLMHNGRMGDIIARTVGNWAWPDMPMRGITNPRSPSHLYNGFSSAYFDSETVAAYEVGSGPVEAGWAFMSRFADEVTFDFDDPICPGCGEQYRGRGGKGNNRCLDCINAYDYHCVACGDGIHDGDQHEHDGDVYCDSCFHSRYTECESCDEYVERDDTREVTMWRWGSRHTERWCEDCRDDCSRCEQCGRTTSNNDAGYPLRCRGRVAPPSRRASCTQAARDRAVVV
jgi:hypothetical protein